MAKYPTIVMTAGISVFSRENFFGKKTRELNIFEFDRTNPIPPAGISEDKAIDDWMKKMQPYFIHARETPEAVSAEYSLLHALERNNALSKNLHVYILYTNTFGGKSASKILKSIISSDFKADIEASYLPDLNVSDRKLLRYALGNFINKLSAILKKYEPNTCLFAPLGGYKVMSSFGYIIGSYHKFQTAYLHEDKQLLHFIPPVPISIDKDFIEKNKELINRLLREREFDLLNFSEYDRKIIEDNAFFFDRIDESGSTLVSLSPFGEFICDRDEHKKILIPYRVFISDIAMSIYNKNPSERLWIHSQLNDLARKYYLDQGGVKQKDLYHERELMNNKGKKTKPLFHLFRGGENENSIFRAAWTYDSKDNYFLINSFWLRHNEYDSDLDRKERGIYREMNGKNEITDKLFDTGDVM